MSLATERRYTIAVVAEMWSFSERTIRRILDEEAGILVIGHPGDGRRRRFQTVRIPESLLQRIHNRLTNPPAALPRLLSACTAKFSRRGRINYGSAKLPSVVVVYKVPPEGLDLSCVAAERGVAFTFVPDRTMLTQTRLANALMALRVEDAIAGGDGNYEGNFRQFYTCRTHPLGADNRAWRDGGLITSLRLLPRVLPC